MMMVRLITVAAAAGWLASIASAGVTYSTTNVQYTNVNIAADDTAMTINGEVDSTGVAVYFNGFGTPGFTPIMLHGQHGVAFVEAFNPLDQLFRMTITAQTGYAFSAMDWKLDAAPPDDGFVTFTAFDGFGNALPVDSGTDTFPFSHTGQNPFDASVVTSDGSYISMLQIVSTVPILDVKQVSVQLVPAPGVLCGLGVGLIALGRRRR